MKANHRNGAARHFSPLQKKTLTRFKTKLAQEMPELRVEWALPYSDTIIELHLEYDKRMYRKIIKASRVTGAVENETVVTIIFR
jgi:hypothetical protein